MKTNLCVIFGGKSVEHEISVISALQAIENLNREKYEIIPLYISKNGDMYTGDVLLNPDNFKDIPALLKKATSVAFSSENGNVYLNKVPAKKLTNNVVARVDVALPVVHGTNVEDGALQGYLKTLGLPFVGPCVLSSAVGMDKFVMKTMLKEGGFPVLPGIRLSKNDSVDVSVEKVEKNFSYPVIVKPVNLGSSVGISIAHNKEELYNSLSDAFSYADRILIERAVTNLREINCSVIGNSESADASECEEPFMGDEILSYKDKYLDGGKGKNGGSKGMASLKRKIPADISPELREKIRIMSVEAFKWLDMNGVSRIDYIIDNDNGELYINEFNTIPGSLSFYLWKPLGVEYSELLDRIISLAFKRSREEEKTTYSFDTNILSMGIGGAKGSKGTKK